MCVRACVHERDKKYLCFISHDAMKVYEEAEVYLRSLLSYALGVEEWSASGLGRFTLEFTLSTRWTGGWLDLG